MLKVGKYYKTIRVRQPKHWMYGMYFKVTKSEIDQRPNYNEYIIEYFNINDYFDDTNIYKNSSWFMNEDFEKKYLKEISEEEYFSQKLVALI